MKELNEGNGGQGTSQTKGERSTQQIALKKEAIKVIDELIEMETASGERMGSVSRADVLNHLLIKKGSTKIWEFIITK